MEYVKRGSCLDRQPVRAKVARQGHHLHNQSITTAPGGGSLPYEDTVTVVLSPITYLVLTIVSPLKRASLFANSPEYTGNKFAELTYCLLPNKSSIVAFVPFLPSYYTNLKGPKLRALSFEGIFCLNKTISP